MGYWGWRPLVWAVFVSVWVSGCRITSEAAVTLPASATPAITLTVRQREPATPMPSATARAAAAAPTAAPAVPVAPAALVYTVRPGDTLLGIALDFGLDVAALRTANPGIDPHSLQVGQQVIVPPPTPETPPPPRPQPIEPPACYDTPTGALLCLGLVTNDQSLPIENVRLQVQLWQTDGTPLAAAETGVEQVLILPGAAAPYGVLFGGSAGDYVAVSAVLLSADPSPFAGERFAELKLEEVRAENHGGRYSVTAVIHNPEAFATGAVRLVLTLLDAEGRVSGYRVLIVADSLPPGERLPVQIEAVSQNADAALTHLLYAEARRVGG